MTSPSRWVAPPPKKALIVGVADMIASNDGGAELVTYSLGSCLGIAIYDPVAKVGGLLHLMLPDSKIDPAKAEKQPYMFVDTGVPRLFHAVYGLGGVKSRMWLKVAGGAQFLDEKQIFNIGRRNISALAEILTRNSVKPESLDVAGQVSRTMRLDLATGNLSIHVPGHPPYLL